MVARDCVDARLCVACVTDFWSLASVWGSPPAFLSAASCFFAAVTAALACETEREFSRRVSYSDCLAWASWLLACVTASLADTRVVASAPSVSDASLLVAESRAAFAIRTWSSALAASAVARTSPAVTMSPTLTATSVTGHVTVVPPAAAVVAAAEVVVPVADATVGSAPKARAYVSAAAIVPVVSACLTTSLVVAWLVV